MQNLRLRQSSLPLGSIERSNESWPLSKDVYSKTYYPPHHNNVIEDMILDEVKNTFPNTHFWIAARTHCYFQLNPGVNYCGVTSGPAKDYKVNKAKFLQGPFCTTLLFENYILSLALV